MDVRLESVAGTTAARWWAVGAAGLAAAVGVVALAGAGASAQESQPASPSDRKSTSIDWRPCGPRLECAHVRVPLDWDHPRGRAISLSVIKHAASDPTERIGSLFIGPGGPGESGVDLVKNAGDDLDAWGDGRFDVVSWDYRGTNASVPVRCFRTPRDAARFWRGAEIPMSVTDSAAFRRRTAALARRCGRVQGWLLPHLSTADSARDLDFLRRSVGDPRLSYVGLSYGTYLGQTYANLFPSRVRAMVLDGVVDPVKYAKSAEARTAGGLVSTDEVFDKFLSQCREAGPLGCALAGHRRTPADLMHRFFPRVRRAPLPAPSANPPGSLNYGDLLLSQFAPMRSPQAWPQNAQSLAAALAGDASQLQDAARPYLTTAGWEATTTSTAIQCADAPARKDSHDWRQVIGRFDRISQMQGRVQGWWLWAPCASWPVRGQDSYRGPWSATTPNPILLISTQHDPNTAYANAVRSQHLLGNAVLLTHGGFGHLSFQHPSACVDQARVDYLVDLVTPGPGSVCPADAPPFPPRP